jgi:hypothetical protein
MDTKQLARWGAVRTARRMSRSVPLIGAALAVLALGAAIRRKGVLGGSVDTALNAVPFVGAAKNMIEMVRGDFIPDKKRLTVRTVGQKMAALTPSGCVGR